MSAPDQARAMVLSRIRERLGVTRREREREAAVHDRLERHPRGTIPARVLQPREALIALFLEMLAGQGAELTRVATPEAAVCAIADGLRTYGLPAALRLGADPQLAALPWDAAPELIRRYGPAVAEDRAGLSRAVAAAAETGTLILASGAANPTSLAFLPEAHTILVAADDILGSYEECFDRLRASYGEGALPRTVNLISGPSRTADIEQTIVKGAHGPKRLHVVILG